MAADKITLERIKQSHPKVREELLQIYNHINEKILGKGVRLRFSYVYRSPEEQDKLFLQRPKVTDARAWQSIHQYGLAFDIVLMYDNNGDENFEEASWNMRRDHDKDGIADWLEVTKYLESKGWKNGFITNGKKWDFPHFQKDFGLSWQKMKAKIDSGSYCSENVNGIPIKYINI
ncbi:MAG TPA: M15 family metallopeptidase [Allosphingosinicella sp.]|jgi:peptidoglycan L-alanyl-D-glutamate endopeptidase CwlK